MDDIFLRQCKRNKSSKRRKHESGGVRFLIPSSFFHEGRTYRQPEVVFISLPQAATGLRFACRARSVGGAFSRTISWRPACAAGRTLRGAFHADLLMSQEALLRRRCSGKYCFLISKLVFAGCGREGRKKWQYFILLLRLSDGAKENPSYPHLHI